MSLDGIIDIIKKDGVEKIILFGSQAYGKPSEDSDFDIAIIKETPLPFHARLKDLRMKVRSTTPFDFLFLPLKNLTRQKKLIHL